MYIYISSHKVENFPYDWVLTNWISLRNRSVTNIERDVDDFNDNDHDSSIPCSWIQTSNGVGAESNNVFNLLTNIWYFEKFTVISFHNSTLEFIYWMLLVHPYL